MQTTEQYLTVREAASQIKMSRGFIYEQICAGNLKASNFGRRYRIKISDFNRFKKQMEIG